MLASMQRRVAIAINAKNALQNPQQRLVSLFSSTTTAQEEQSSTTQLPANLYIDPEKPKPERRFGYPESIRPEPKLNSNSMVELPVMSFSETELPEILPTIELDPEVYDAEVRLDILQRVVKWQLAKKRQGTAKTKTRSEVSGSTRKPWKQKGSGRARVGDIRAPQWRGGYTVHGKVQRDFGYSLPKKVRAMGLRVALSSKLKEGKLAVVDNLKVDNLKTKHMKNLLEAKNWEKTLFIHDDEDVDSKFLLGCRNLSNVNVLPNRGANVYSIMKSDVIVLSSQAARNLQERLAAP